jgi:hypothetical protein
LTLSRPPPSFVPISTAKQRPYLRAPTVPWTEVNSAGSANHYCYITSTTIRVGLPQPSLLHLYIVQFPSVITLLAWVARSFVGMENIRIPSPSAILNPLAALSSGRSTGSDSTQNAAPVQNRAAATTNKPKQSKSRNGTVHQFSISMQS